VQTLYKFLYDNYGKKIISGSMANVSVEQSEAALVKAATGKTPMMQTFDFCFVTLTADRSTWEQNSVYQDISYYKNLWEQGGIVSACWHLNVPTQEAYAAKDEVNDQNKAWGAQVYFSAKNAVKDGTWENDFLKYSFDCAAEVLLKYKAEGIPVVWRPFHEGSGNATISGKDSDAWFWWGKDGAEAYKKLWVYMFDYFKAKSLDNLIWVWTTQIGVGSDGSENWYCKDDSNWYPGDQYVDIIARDNYNKAKASASITEFETIKQFWPNKMIALGENGGIANISDIFKNGGKYSYFMPWYTYNLKDLNKSDHAKLSWWQDAAKCDDVIFLEDIK
jgi:mannan endo-1,4-beta-mannosidase